MAFCDSHLFEINEDGVPFHKRSGESYADKAINGVSLDDTIWWENEMWLPEVDDILRPSVMVGERINQVEIKETSTSPGKEKGEGKFYREKKIPSKKKKFQTKPRPIDSRNKRLPKVALELGDLGWCTERIADAELDEVHCNPNTVCPFDDPFAIRYVMDTRSRSAAEARFGVGRGRRASTSLPGMSRRSRKLVGTCEEREPNLRPCARRACPLC